MDGDDFVIPPAGYPDLPPIIFPPSVLQTAGGVITGLVPAPASNTFVKDDGHAPPWLLNKSREAMRDTEGDMRWVPKLGPLLKEADGDDKNFKKIKPAQTRKTIAAVLYSQFHTANHAFIIVYNSPKIEGGTIQQIIAVAVNQAGSVYAFTNVADYWNTVTQVEPEEIIEMLGVNSFAPEDNEEIYLYSYTQSLEFSSMPSIPEGEESDNDKDDGPVAE